VTLDLAEQETLLRAARDELEAVICGRERHPLAMEEIGALAHETAAFVTLRTPDGALRGCVGTVEPRSPLASAVREMALAAALRDTRFSPVSAAELETLVVHINVLGPLTPIRAEDVRVGTHGLLVEQDSSRGVLLPEVALERGWDRERFLGETCRKAGLPTDAWREPETVVYGFTAQPFGE
jgi:AmmeMemoRadiSam system protein A